MVGTGGIIIQKTLFQRTRIIDRFTRLVVENNRIVAIFKISISRRTRIEGDRKKQHTKRAKGDTFFHPVNVFDNMKTLDKVTPENDRKR